MSPVSPEQRRRQRAAGVRTAIDQQLSRLGPGTRIYEVAKRTVVGVYTDGFIHAGNLAYLTLITLFPFFIVTAALASLFGRSADTLHAVAGFLVALPPSVQKVVQQPILDVLNARTGGLLWLGGLVGLWTVGSFIETIRDILRRAYGTPFTNPFWQYRLVSIGIIFASVVLVMIAFSAQVLLTAVEQFVYRLLPFAEGTLSVIGISKLIPLAVLWLALYALIWSLTPSRYRFSNCPKWPGALFTALWWHLMIYILPILLGGLKHYDLTYGSLAGVIISLIFFWFVGLGLVVGVHLNAALAEPPDKGLMDAPETVTESA
ncbi:MAG: YihY/virulence factor BrkB family protein [Sphingomonadaceae bacterium]|nr:YihY/virulence factor BrkB family protein [Sphingomonadaceae bacterium]